MKSFKEFLKEQPTNWTRSNVNVPGFSADAEDPVAGFDVKLFPDSLKLHNRSIGDMDLLSQDFQTPEEINKPIYANWGGVYPVLHLTLDSAAGDGESIDTMVKASNEYLNFISKNTQNAVRKQNLKGFLNNLRV